MPDGAARVIITGGARTVLTEHTTFYINSSTGNDTTGDGSSAHPWATIQYAYGWVGQNLDQAKYVVTLQLSNGDHEGIYSDDAVGKNNGPIVVLGNLADVTACRITKGTGPINVGSYAYMTGTTGALSAIYFNFVTFHGTGGTTVFSGYANYVGLGADPINGFLSGKIKYTGSFTAIADSGYSGKVEMYGDHEFALSVGSVLYWMQTYFSYSWQNMDVITFTNALSFAEATIVAGALSYSFYQHISISGTNTGKKYDSYDNSVIQANSAMPGTIAGTKSTGGIGP